MRATHGALHRRSVRTNAVLFASSAWVVIPLVFWGCSTDPREFGAGVGGKMGAADGGAAAEAGASNHMGGLRGSGGNVSGGVTGVGGVSGRGGAVGIGGSDCDDNEPCCAGDGCAGAGTAGVGSGGESTAGQTSGGATAAGGTPAGGAGGTLASGGAASGAAGTVGKGGSLSSGGSGTGGASKGGSGGTGGTLATGGGGGKGGTGGTLATGGGGGKGSTGGAIATGGKANDPTCGDFGQPCCAANACDQGACLNARCSTFGGVYSSSTELGCVGNPLASNTCACPAGFSRTAFNIIGSYDEGSPFFRDVSFCSGVDAPGGDYRGVYKRGCGNGVSVSNPYTGALSCPSGAIATTYNVIDYNGTSSCSATYVVCRGSGTGTFGGIFQQFSAPICPGTPGNPGTELCKVRNPVTGACSCPAGTSEYRHPHRILHPDQSAASGYSCDAATVVCIGP